MGTALELLPPSLEAALLLETGMAAAERISAGILHTLHTLHTLHAERVSAATEGRGERDEREVVDGQW